MTDTGDSKYYADLLSRVDNTLLTNPQVAFQGNYQGLEPATVPQTLAQHVLFKHSVLGVCWHQDVALGFTRPLKIYFTLSSVLLVIFLSLKIRLATGFAEWCIVSSILNFIHFGQRLVFYRFQDSIILWPFFAGAVVISLIIYDLYCFATIGGEGLRHGLGMAILVYLFGFLLPETVLVTYKHYKKQRQQGPGQQQQHQQQHSTSGVPAGTDRNLGVEGEDYSTL